MTHAERFLLAGVMGCPVMHSRSPKLHNYWLARHGLAGAYLPLAIPPEKLNVALRALPALGFAGCNLTIPHKQTALDFVDTVDPLAQSIGAVNCVVVRPDGSLAGFNHDAFGYIESVREAQPNWRADTGPIAVIGAGGAARAVIIAFVEQGAREIRLVNRTPARAKKLERDLGGPITTIAWEHRERALDGAAMLVNTTNQGMIGEFPRIFASICCRRARWFPISSTSRARRRCWPRPAAAAMRRSMDLACCCIRRAPPSVRGSGSCPMSPANCGP